MNSIENFIKQNLPNGISLDNFYIAVTCLVVLLCVIAFDPNMWKRNQWSGNIKAIQERRKELQTGAIAPKKRKKPEASINFMRLVSNKFQLVKKLQLGKAEAMLVQANFRSKDAISIFAFFTLITPFILGGIGLTIMQMQAPPATLFGKLMIYLYPLSGLYIGLKLPWVILGRKLKKRLLALQRALSDTLDLMTVCAEAGLSMPAAMDRVSRDLGIAYPEMAEELALTSLEISFYPDRNKALTNLAERCALKEIKGIVTVLIQTEKYGTPISQALRVLSAEFRQTRMMRAETKAAKLPALMTMPMILFILPTVFIIIMSPAVISAKKNFAGVSAKK